MTGVLPVAVIAPRRSVRPKRRMITYCRKVFFFSSPVFFFCLTMQLPILVGPPFYSLRAASLVPSLWIRRKRAAPSTFRSIKRPTADPGPNLIRLPIVHRLMEEKIHSIFVSFFLVCGDRWCGCADVRMRPAYFLHRRRTQCTKSCRK